VCSSDLLPEPIRLAAQIKHRGKLKVRGSYKAKAKRPEILGTQLLAPQP
jgi:hypothetical protein